MTRFLLIRHASTYSVGKSLSGRHPGVHLNEEGDFQTHRLCSMLSKVPIDSIYCSPLERALETATPISKLFDIPLSLAEELNEIDFGAWTNKTFEELDNDPQFKLFNTYRSNSRIPHGETMLEAQLRIVNALQNLAFRHPKQTIAIVSHADMIKSAIAFYSGIPLDLMQRIEIAPASVSILELDQDTAKICLINNTGQIR